ncbi:hypothetical protein SUGI_0855530 [Cryptomeria japonica]|nr:hypothetical protein SUGI_0855530 [Cryptomeria japonica]
MEDSKPVGTPMVTSCRLSKEDDSDPVDETEYRSMIGKLHYVFYGSLDIAHAVGIVVKFQKSLKKTHMVAVKRIFSYLRGTIDYGLWYAYKGNFSFKVFTDANWASNVDYQKTTISGAFFLGGRLVS